jgi:hypothetical protein
MAHPMSVILDAASVSNGQVSDPYVPGLQHPDPPTGSMCCGGGGSGEALFGDGPPDASLGNVGDTYVDNLNNAFYWKSESGWNP